MARLARIVVPECPRHVTARGNRREPIFFEEGDQEIYCDILAEQVRRAGVQVWAYCLMPNHVHLVLYPSTEDGLGRALGGAHRRWANYVNVRGRWRGHLFDGRFASVAMDERHLLAAVRYVSLNPVRAGLTASAQAWPWSGSLTWSPPTWRSRLSAGCGRQSRPADRWERPSSSPISSVGWAAPSPAALRGANPGCRPPKGDCRWRDREETGNTAPVPIFPEG